MKRVAIFLFFLPLSAAAGDKPFPTLKLQMNLYTESWQWPALPASTLIQDNDKDKVKAPPPTAGRAPAAKIVVTRQPSTDASAPAPILTPHAPAPPGSAVLHWKNGETIRGDIATASPTGLTWKTPLFEDPLQLEWHVLDRIDWPQAPSPAKDPFSFALRDGSFIFGDLVSIGEDSISIHSARHGDTLLKRSEVLNARKLSHGNLLFSGPLGDVGWQATTSQQDGNVTLNQGARAGGLRVVHMGGIVRFGQAQAGFGPPGQPDTASPLTAGPDGALLIRSWNRGALLDVKLPDLVEVEFHVRSSKRPEFSLSLGANFRESLRVETWDDELVLTVHDQFKAIRKIEENERDVALRVCWDNKAQKCSVFTEAGELITTWQVPEKPSGSDPALILQNKGLDLSLDFLRVRAWDGKPPAKIDLKQSHVELADGRSMSGEIVAGPPGFIKLQTSGQTAAADFPLGDVDALVFSSDPPQVASHEATLLYADGAILFGRIASISDGRAAIVTSFTKEPLVSQMDLPRQLLIRAPAPLGAAPEPPLADQDKILTAQTTLHGKLGSAGDDSLGWTPVGGIKASRLSKTLVSEITRSLPPDATPAADSALFYMSSGDVLPGSLKSLDRSGAEFESDLMAARKLSASELDAIQFSASIRINVQGFGGAGWRIVKGDEKSVRRANDGIQMDAGTAIAYPSLMQSSEISFTYASTGFSATRLRMFCAGTDGAHSTNLVLGNTGNQFITALESGENQFEDQAQIRTKPGEPISVRLKLEEDQVEVFVNDMSLQHIPIDPAKCAGSGLIIEPAGLWGNGVFPISLSGFSAHSVPGRIWLPEVSTEIKTQVLTVPRFQKDDPPRHLLLAANGDVLRGEVEAATDSHFGFRCGLENLNVPRDRVKAVILLKPPDENSTAAPAATAASNPLNQRIPMQINFGEVGLSQLIAFLKGQVGDFKINLPEKEDPRTIPIQIGNQTLGDALRIICARFNLHYRLDSDGTIILEPFAQEFPVDFDRKTYWLKPDAIPKDASAQDFLTTKGIAFPKGSFAQWQSNAGLLAMTNTAENQTKLAALIASDFGGSLGSPTHWLLLTSGGRLALTVDKFEPDFITGHHPVYGSIKVPMSQVFIIRTSAPGPTATIKALENWRLVNAPEPVLPEPGGESSPLLGKDASTFKLPLLEGGDFDLDAAKGQVVVLDFWASWCGPCIKSLPGLIETMSSFPADRVKLIGVNQGESPEQVKHFLETKGLKFKVAMDADQSVARKYGVDAIPHTVIVGPDGKVAWMQTGYNPDGETEASDVVKHLLQAPSPANTPAKGPTQ